MVWMYAWGSRNCRVRQPWDVGATRDFILKAGWNVNWLFLSANPGPARDPDRPGLGLPRLIRATLYFDHNLTDCLLMGR